MHDYEYSPILKLLFDQLAGSHLPDSPLSASKELYNEGALLRIALALESKGVHCLPFRFAEGARWLAEPLLYSAFQANFQGDKQAERHTHADGVVGNVAIDKLTKRGLELSPDARQFVVIESKLFSDLSSGTTNAVDYDQAVRNVACMAETLKRTGLRASQVDSMGFYVIAPHDRVARHQPLLTQESMNRKVESRISIYPHELQAGLRSWKLDWFDPLLEKAVIATETWEAIIERCKKSSPLEGKGFEEFYIQCRERGLLRAFPAREEGQPLPILGEIYLVDDELVLVTGPDVQNCRVVPIHFEGPYFPPSKLIATSAFGQPDNEKHSATHCRPQNKEKYLWSPPVGESYCPPKEKPSNQPSPPCRVVVTVRGGGETTRVESVQDPVKSFLVYPHHLRVE